MKKKYIYFFILCAIILTLGFFSNSFAKIEAGYGLIISNQSLSQKVKKVNNLLASNEGLGLMDYYINFSGTKRVCEYNGNKIIKNNTNEDITTNNDGTILFRLPNKDGTVTIKNVTITYKEAATGLDGKKYDVRITLSELILNDYKNRTGSDLKYLSIYKYNANGLWVEGYGYKDINNQSSKYRNFQYFIEGGIDYKVKIEIDGASSGQKFLFAAEDVDIADRYGRYGDKSESITFSKGFNLDTIRIQKDSYLTGKLNNNNKIYRIAGSQKNDYDNGKASFTIEADAKETIFKWKADVCCGTLLIGSNYQPKVASIIVEGRYLNGSNAGQVISDYNLYKTISSPRIEKHFAKEMNNLTYEGYTVLDNYTEDPSKSIPKESALNKENSIEVQYTLNDIKFEKKLRIIFWYKKGNTLTIRYADFNKWLNKDKTNSNANSNSNASTTGLNDIEELKIKEKWEISEGKIGEITGKIDKLSKYKEKFDDYNYIYKYKLDNGKVIEDINGLEKLEIKADGKDHELILFYTRANNVAVRYRDINSGDGEEDTDIIRPDYFVFDTENKDNNTYKYKDIDGYEFTGKYESSLIDSEELIGYDGPVKVEIEEDELKKLQNDESVCEIIFWYTKGLNVQYREVVKTKEGEIIKGKIIDEIGTKHDYGKIISGDKETIYIDKKVDDYLTQNHIYTSEEVDKLPSDIEINYRGSKLKIEGKNAYPTNIDNVYVTILTKQVENKNGRKTTFSTVNYYTIYSFKNYTYYGVTLDDKFADVDEEKYVEDVSRDNYLVTFWYTSNKVIREYHILLPNYDKAYGGYAINTARNYNLYYNKDPYENMEKLYITDEEMSEDSKCKITEYTSEDFEEKGFELLFEQLFKSDDEKNNLTSNGIKNNSSSKGSSISKNGNSSSEKSGKINMPEELEYNFIEIYVDGVKVNGEQYRIAKYDGKNHTIKFYYKPYVVHISYVLVTANNFATINEDNELEINEKYGDEFFIGINKELAAKSQNNLEGILYNYSYDYYIGGQRGVKLIHNPVVTYSYTDSDFFGIRSGTYINKCVIDGELEEGEPIKDGTGKIVGYTEETSGEYTSGNHEITYFYFKPLKVTVIPVWRRVIKSNK